jgi:endoglucanase
MVPPTEVTNDNENAIVGTGRYLYPPSTAATLNLAATGAVCARVWETIDPAFSQKCLTEAELAWNAALANPEVYAGNNPGTGGGNYSDTNVSDEFYWAASELFISTGEEEYKTYLLGSDLFANASSFDWGNTAPLGTISLVTVETDLPADKETLLGQNILAYADDLLAQQTSDGYSALIKGAYPWGSNGTILNNMMLVSEAYKITGDAKYLDAVRESMNYLMGRNPVNISYISGYGTYSMQHPHHRFWANDLGNGYPPPPAGVVSGGPNADPTDPVAVAQNLKDLPESKRYLDNIGSYTTNEVAINWNAPLVWVSAFLDNNR